VGHGAIAHAAFDDETAGDPIVDGIRVVIVYVLAVLAIARTAIRERIRRPD
jgi:hypothetical protein